MESTSTSTVNTMKAYEKLVLVHLHVSTWSGTIVDREASRRNAEAYGADSRQAKVIKALVDVGRTREIKTAINELWSWHYQVTLPWQRRGAAVIAAERVLQYLEEYDQRAAKIRQLYENFVNDYETLIEQAKDLLKGMWQERDYPTVDEIRRHFDISVDFRPVQGDDFRLSVPDSIADQIRTQVRGELESQIQAGMQEAWQRIREAVKRFVPNDDGESKFWSDGIDKLRGLVQALPGLNLTGDQALEDMRAEIDRELCRYSAHEIKTDKGARQDVVQKASEIARKIDQAMGILEPEPEAVPQVVEETQEAATPEPVKPVKPVKPAAVKTAKAVKAVKAVKAEPVKPMPVPVVAEEENETIRQMMEAGLL